MELQPENIKISIVKKSFVINDTNLTNEMSVLILKNFEMHQDKVVVLCFDQS